MHKTRVQKLQRQPWDMALLPTGEVLLISWSPAGLWLDAFDADLGLLWSRNVGAQAKGLNVDQHGTPWVIDPTGVSAFSRRGDDAIRRDAPTFQGMEVSALAFVGDELVFAYQHSQDAPPGPPTLVCLTAEGTIRWSTRLSTESIAFEGRPVGSQPINHGGQFIPTTWVCAYIQAGELTVSGDAILAVYSDMPRSGVAIGYAVSLTDGTLRYVTQLGPIHHVAARGSGAFLVGYQGYGAFETVLYDERGTEQNRWASHGHYVARGDDIRVIEMENVLPSRCRLGRLISDGTVIRGDLLNGYYTSQPYTHQDGMVYFARDGIMMAAHDLLIVDRVQMYKSSEHHGVFHTRVLAGREGLFSTYSTYRPSSASTSASSEHVSGLVLLGI